MIDKQLDLAKMKGIIPDIKYQEQIIFCLVFGIVIYGQLTNDDGDQKANIQKGIAAICLIAIAESAVKSYDILFLRPNMGFWRGVLKLCQIYNYILVFLAFQNADQGRQIMRYFDDSLGKPVSEHIHAYDFNCAFEWQVIWKAMDHYYLIHCFGNFILVFVFRDAFMVYIFSLLTEVSERTFQHILPHFRECWWDSLILDICLSNTPAILLAHYLLQKSKLNQYDFFGRNGSWNITKWDCWRCHRRFGLCIVLILVYLQAMTGGFFIINNLWIPPPTPIPVIRCIIWFFMGVLSCKEIFFDLITWNKPIRKDIPISGKMRWTGCAMLLLENIVIIKYFKNAGNVFYNPTPLKILIPWTIAISTIVVVYLYLRFKKDRTTIYGNEVVEQKKQKNE